MIDTLLSLWHRVRDVPVLLFSHHVASDDLSSVRRAICGGTLRLPLSRAGCDRALDDARRNNLAGQAAAPARHEARSGPPPRNRFVRVV